MIRYYFLLVFIFSSCCGQEVNLDFSQNEYDVKLDIVECPNYNKSYFKYLEVGLGWYNRSQRVINAKFELIVDVDKKYLNTEVQVYKFTSNEYRFFPVTFKMNSCAEYNRNAFSLRDMFLKTSNINPCNLKRGSYHAKNVMISSSKFPPHVPRGSYKAVGICMFRSDFIAQVDFYIRIIDKPIDWEKIPKSRTN